MPAQIKDTGKVIFVLRNPRDVLVSLYHFNKNDETLKFDIDFDIFFEVSRRLRHERKLVHL